MSVISSLGSGSGLVRAYSAASMTIFLTSSSMAFSAASSAQPFFSSSYST